jgi:DNA mismatch endonuclease (patch repair protein)
MVVRRLLHARGLRYRLHSRKLPGSPDLVFSRAKIVVFIDGDFWHGYHWESIASKMAPYWKTKIEGNILRDARRNEELATLGWHVIRIWEHDIKNSPMACADLITNALENISTSKP